MEIHDYSKEAESKLSPEEYDELHPTAGYKPRRKKAKWRRLLPVFVILVIVVAGGFGSYKLFGHKKATPAKQPVTSEQPKPDSVKNSGTSTYTAPEAGQNLSFNYPSSWQVTPASGQPGGTITVTSPLVSLNGASGTATTGRVVVQIRADNSKIDELANTTATTADDSLQYAYKSPTPNQHQYFYVSYLHFKDATTNTSTAFEEVVITGGSGLAKGTAVTTDSLGGVFPLITASFYDCQTQKCDAGGRTKLSVADTSLQQDQTLQAVLNLFESFQFH